MLKNTCILALFLLFMFTTDVGDKIINFMNTFPSAFF
jgi:hypothetical protein